jgi:signal transduction histidine kinase
MVLPMNANKQQRLRDLEQLSQRQQQQLQQCQKLLDSQVQERQLFALEIHDGFVQECTGALMLLESLAAEIQDQPQPWSPKLAQSIELLRSSLDEARRLMRGLRPPGLDTHGLLPPLRDLLADFRDRLGLDVEFQHPPTIPRLLPAAELALYRIVQEALHNVWKHSACSQATIELGCGESGLTLTITDRGRGFDPAAVAADRIGVAGIGQRVGMLDGTAEIASTPGQGTQIKVVLPATVWLAGAKSDL